MIKAFILNLIYPGQNPVHIIKIIAIISGNAPLSRSIHPGAVVAAFSGIIKKTGGAHLGAGFVNLPGTFGSSVICLKRAKLGDGTGRSFRK